MVYHGADALSIWESMRREGFKLKNLLIIGTGGFAREVFWHAQNSIGFGKTFIIKGFLEGNIALRFGCYDDLPLPVFNNVIDYSIEKDDVFVIAIADVNAKIAIAKIIDKKGGMYLNLIHKTSMVSEKANMGTDVILCPFTTVSVNVKIGNHVMLNSYSSLGHDATLGDYISIMGHVDITGNVKVEKASYWGSGARALPHSKIGEHSLIGAGSVVLKKVKAGQTVFGNPAVPI